MAPWILEKLPLPPEPESFRRAAGERACPWAARAVGPSSLGRRGLYLAQRAVLPASDCPSPPTPCSPSGAPATYPVLCLHPKDFPSSLVIRQALNLAPSLFLLVFVPSTVEWSGDRVFTAENRLAPPWTSSDALSLRISRVAVFS